MEQEDGSVNEWQPIETAPKDGTWFMGWCGAHCLARYEVCTEQFEDEIGWGYVFTHWMPLPAPPSS